MVDWDWDRVVFDHVKVTVADAAASVAFYKTVLEPLQIPPLWESERGAQFANLVVIGGDERSGPIHMGFVAQTRAPGRCLSRSRAGCGLPRQRPARRTRAVQLRRGGSLLRRVPARPRRQQRRGRRAGVRADSRPRRRCPEAPRELERDCAAAERTPRPDRHERRFLVGRSGRRLRRREPREPA